MSKVIVLAGMHRSGTSLSSSILEKAGLYIGENLLGAGAGNSEGHFENMDFLNFHKAILTRAGLHEDWGLTGEDFHVPASFDKQAKEIIRNNEKELWGWKEPRTTLFLHYWHNLLPNSYFIFLYRSPLDVFDSLLRRGDPYLLAHPERFLEVWKTYNARVVAFQALHPSHTIVRHIEQITEDPKKFIRDINSTFGLSLSENFDPNIKKEMLGKLSSSAAKLEAALFQENTELRQIYEGLNTASDYRWSPTSIAKEQALSVNEWLHQQALLRRQKQQIHDMKNSSFWKLRNWIFKLLGKNTEV